ncbi:ATP-binding protein [Fulvivirga lutea]|uniref:histidine kinase n=1 Tax=Fulvivirga lutea TaxID=2810512 RepID=A0A974ZZT3_9BACT|nr:ATP-binding protein [Fulvivirga lutea]QSE96101.1 hypothetical protein JR347_10780 [Fulvivirga lutea]
MLRYLSTILFLTLSLNSIGQVHEGLEIKIYKNTDINASRSNITITEHKSGLLVLANYEGLISYDGNKWRLEFGGEIVPCIYYDSIHNLLLYGGKNHFGYISINSKGLFVLNDLSKLVPEIPSSFITWRIFSTDELVLFSTNKGIFLWEIKEKDSIDYLGNGTRMFYDRTNLYYSQGDSILYLFDGNKRVLKTSIPQEDMRLASVFQQNNSFIFLYDDGNVIGPNIFKSKVNDKILYPFFLKDSSLLFTNAENGIQLFDKNLLEITSLNKENGLADGFTRHAEEDRLGNIWATSTNGLSHVKIGSPWQIQDFSQSQESFQVTFLHNNMFLTATSKHIIKIEEDKQTNLAIDLFQSMDVLDNRIILGTRQGIQLLNLNLEIVDSINLPITAFVKFIDQNHLLVSQSSDTYLFKISNNELKQIKRLNLPHPVFYDSKIHNGKAWFTTKFGEVFIVNVDNGTFEKFSNIDGLDFKRECSLLIIDDQIFTTVGNKLYKFSTKKNSFEYAYTFKEGIIKAIQEIGDNYIVFGENNLNEKFLYEVNFSANSYHIESYKFNNFPFRELEDIDYDGKRYVYFTTADNIYKFDTQNTNYLNTKFNTLIRNVSSIDSTLSRGYYTVYTSSDTIPRISTNQTKEAIPSLTYDYNSIRFEYAATFLELPEKTKYSYSLEGYDKTWSEWTKETTKEYTNLSPGQYTFKVKSLNVFKEEGTTATYTFTILPPWYMTTWAYALFAIGGVLSIWFIVLAYSYRVRLQRRKLKLIVADRTFEVLSQKKEIEKQNEKLKEQFEEIQQQRDDINEKNQELELSQEEILSINERLQELNSSLEKKVDERTSEIRVTVKKLQSTIAELDTFIYRASHDLKGPISRINGLTSLAKLEASNPNDIKYYNLIELVAKDMNKLLAKLTQVHEVINCEVEKSVIDLPVMISDVRNTIKFLDPEDTAKYSFNLETTLQVKTDPFLLAIVLTNLMENSLIFRHSGKPCEINITTAQSETEYTITFTDNGAGIPPEHIDKVFNMFHRGSDQSKGSGLGLYLSQMAIEKLGGSIKVESEYNVYTKFTIIIPK